MMRTMIRMSSSSIQPKEPNIETSTFLPYRR
jgi:hypothetical protein